MKYKFKAVRRKIPDNELIDDLRKTGKKFRKKHISFNEYKKEGQFCPTVFLERFGSWNAALLKAGLKTVYKAAASESELLFNLKKVWDALGRQPLYYEVEHPVSKYHPSTYVRRFGSWNNALLALEKACRNGKLKAFKPQTDEIRACKSKSFKRAVRKIRKAANVSKSLRFDVFNRDRFRCRLCGASPANDLNVKLHVDHIIPVSKGGRTILSNLQTACKDCNLGKRAKLMLE